MPIVLDLKPSRLLPWLLTGGHVGAAFAFWVSLGASVWLLPALALIGLSLWRALSRDESPQLGLEEDGTLLLAPAAVAAPRRAVALAGTVVLAEVVWLVWREEEGGGRGARMILREQLAPPEWRALQVWARLRAGPRAGGAGR